MNNHSVVTLTVAFTIESAWKLGFIIKKNIYEVEDEENI